MHQQVQQQPQPIPPIAVSSAVEIAAPIESARTRERKTAWRQPVSVVAVAAQRDEVKALDETGVLSFFGAEEEALWQQHRASEHIPPSPIPRRLPGPITGERQAGELI